VGVQLQRLGFDQARCRFVVRLCRVAVFVDESTEYVGAFDAAKFFDLRGRRLRPWDRDLEVDAAVRPGGVKLIWLAIADIEDKRARAREKERGKPRDVRTAPGRLIEGHVTQGWKQALNALSTVFEGRIPEHAL
jgi:hypothetical protein